MQALKILFTVNERVIITFVYVLGFYLQSFISHLRRHHYKIKFSLTSHLRNGHYGLLSFQGRNKRLDRFLTKKTTYVVYLMKHQRNDNNNKKKSCPVSRPGTGRDSLTKSRPVPSRCKILSLSRCPFVPGHSHWKPQFKNDFFR